MPILTLLFDLASCGGGDPVDPEEVQHSTLGTWSGTTAEGVWVEAVITDEGVHCCLVATGTGRLTAEEGDTLRLEVSGLVNPDEVLLNFKTENFTFIGQFKGQFADATTVGGVMSGPEAIGEPPAGPFPGEGVALQLRRD